MYKINFQDINEIKQKSPDDLSGLFYLFFLSLFLLL